MKSCGKIWYCQTGHRWWHTMVLTFCVLNGQGYRHTLGICNTYCFSMATMVSWTHLNVTFIHTLPTLLCYIRTLSTVQIIQYQMTCDNGLKSCVGEEYGGTNPKISVQTVSNPDKIGSSHLLNKIYDLGEALQECLWLYLHHFQLLRIRKIASSRLILQDIWL